MKAIKKPIEILAKRYTKDSDLDSLLNLLRSNKNEPVRFEESTGDLFIQKDRGEIRLTLGNWIIFEENTDRCFWFIDHEIFLETYSFLAEEGEFSRFVKKVYEIDFVDFTDLESYNIEKVLRFIENLTLGTAAVGYRTESLHGAGSPQAQRIMISRQSNLEAKKQLVKDILDIDI